MTTQPDQDQTIECEEFHQLMMDYRSADYLSSNPQDAYEKIVALIDSKLQKAGEPILRDQFAMAALPIVRESHQYKLTLKEAIDLAYTMADEIMEAGKPK